MESIITDSYTVTTLLGSATMLSKLIPGEYNQRKEFSINTLLNFFPDKDMTYEPKLMYFGIGIGGAYNADDEYLRSAYKPDRRNMGLFKPIPLRCRPIDEDITEAERAKYRFRVRENIDGEDKWCYYAKKLKFNNGIAFKRFSVSGKEEPYELDAQNLTPKPTKPKDSDMVKSDSSSIVAYCEAELDIAAGEVLEYIRAKYKGDTRYAVISELGLFTGSDEQVEGVTDQNVPITYNEAIGAQLFSHTTWVGTALTSEGMTMRSNFMITSTGIDIK